MDPKQELSTFNLFFTSNLKSKQAIAYLFSTQALNNGVVFIFKTRSKTSNLVFS
jgi:hypothetical protein